MPTDGISICTAVTLSGSGRRRRRLGGLRRGGSGRGAGGRLRRRPARHGAARSGRLRDGRQARRSGPLGTAVVQTDHDERDPRHPQDDRERPGGETLHVAESSPPHRCTAGSRPGTVASPRSSSRPAGLLTDFDGTLSPIVADPAHRPARGRGVRRARGARGAARGRRHRHRPLADSTRAAWSACPACSSPGNHGTEWIEPGADEPVPSPALARLRPIFDAVLDRVPGIDGVIVEHKGLSASVHYRNAADPEATRLALIATRSATLPGRRWSCGTGG